MELTPFCVTSFYDDEPHLPCVVQVLRVTATAPFAAFEQWDFHMCVSDGNYYTVVYSPGVPPSDLTGTFIRVIEIRHRTMRAAQETHVYPVVTFERVAPAREVVGKPAMWGYSQPKVVSSTPRTETLEVLWKLEVLKSLRSLESAVATLFSAMQEVEDCKGHSTA